MIERIKKIIDLEGMNPSSFSDYIGISRSSMNHILNGRNNPSLDVLTKILSKFNKYNSDWLLFGTLPIRKDEKSIIQPSLFNEILIEQNKPEIKPEYPKEKEIKTETKIQEPIVTEKIIYKEKSPKTISRIMIFYSDNTYESLTPDNKS